MKTLNIPRVLLVTACVAALVALAGGGLLTVGAAVGVGLLCYAAASFAFSQGNASPALFIAAGVPEFLFDFESRMQTITENEFARMTLSDNMWWRRLTKVRSTGKKREILAWLLSTARIRDQGKKGGNMHFENMMAKYVEYNVVTAGEGLELERQQLEDNDGDGFDFGAEWSSQMGAQMAYWPQKKIAELILAGEDNNAYDGKKFFADNSAPHPNNPFKNSAGFYANLFTGAAAAASGGKPKYPGALKIDESVTLDSAFVNVAKALSYIASLKMPNGVDPRFLKVVGLMVPPILVPRAQQLTNAKYIAQAAANAATAGGSSDVEAIVRAWAFGDPIMVQEFATADSADETSWYLITEQTMGTQLGSFVYIDREPFSIRYYTGQGAANADLDRMDVFQWHCRGRNVAGYGHPYGIFKANAA